MLNTEMLSLHLHFFLDFLLLIENDALSRFGDLTHEFQFHSDSVLSCESVNKITEFVLLLCSVHGYIWIYTDINIYSTYD